MARSQQTLLQQFKDLEKDFKDSYSYKNTGTTDQSDIVARFFINAYTLREIAAAKNDAPARFMIDKDMRHYEMQFGKMLGGDDAVEEAKHCGRTIAAFMGDVRLRRESQQAVAADARFTLN